MEESKISEYYHDKNILITGATGFVGKLLIEKLLRSSQPRALYLLIRPKRSVEPKERLAEIFKSPLFDKLKTTVPDYMKRLVLVSGDVMEPDLGLADADRKVLIDNVNVVFHGAATVRFDEPLSTATKINVIGTISILQLCKQMKKIESIVHVSTAYSNYPHDKIEEEFYDPPVSPENLIKLTECLNDHQLEQVTQSVIGKWPNTYAFTKAIAEEAVRIHGKGLPIAVFRPAIITSTRSEPIKGWTANLSGPNGMMVAYGAGVLKVLHTDYDKRTELVPADMAINCLVAVGYKTALCSTSGTNILIYNFTTHNNNILSWKRFLEIATGRGFEVPVSRTIWYYTLTNCKSVVAYRVLTFLVHTIPALIVDFGLVLMNKKPRALKIYKKVHKFSELMKHFLCRSWDFSYDNVSTLWRKLEKKDQELYNFDMESVDWYQFIRDYTDGVRLYVFEEKIETVSYAKKKLLLLWVVHRTVQILFFSTAAWSLWRLKSFASWMMAAR